MNRGEKNKPIRGLSERARLLQVCALLNKERAKYLVIGAHALTLHGIVRATTDVDILIPKDMKNTEKILKALEGLGFGISKELDADEVSKKPWTIIGDIPRVDLLTVACRVKYEDAFLTALKTKIDGVNVPYVDYQTLVRTKQTDRLQDKADIQRLKEIHKKVS